MLKKIERKAYQWFGAFTKKHVSESLRNNLRSAHMNIREDAFLAIIILYTIISGIVTSIIVLLLGLLVFPLFSFTLPFPLDFIFMLMPLILMTVTYMVLLQIPVSKAKARGKQIDVNLSYALNFVAAMSSAGVTPTEIFKSLSKQKIYGEVQKEAAWIYRDVSMMGKDIIQSIKDNMYRSPSERFREFLQGLIVTITSGGSLKTYFTAKADQYMVENRQKQRQLFESLGIMAESYVTAAVAGILLLFIVIPLMMIISGDSNQISFLYIITFAIVPLIHMGFTVVIRMMSLEV